MKIKITYPKVSPKIIKHQRLINFMKWPLLIAVVICPIINLITGGKAWSLVVLMSIYMAWDLVISRDLVEYNRISQFVKLITLTSLLLITIDVFLTPGWALEAVPILIFSGLIVTSVLFFTDIERQKQNIFPFLFLILLSQRKSTTINPKSKIFLDNYCCLELWLNGLSIRYRNHILTWQIEKKEVVLCGKTKCH